MGSLHIYLTSLNLIISKEVIGTISSVQYLKYTKLDYMKKLLLFLIFIGFFFKGNTQCRISQPFQGDVNDPICRDSHGEISTGFYELYDQTSKRRNTTISLAKNPYDKTITLTVFSSKYFERINLIFDNDRNIKLDPKNALSPLVDIGKCLMVYYLTTEEVNILCNGKLTHIIMCEENFTPGGDCFIVHMVRDDFNKRARYVKIIQYP